MAAVRRDPAIRKYGAKIASLIAQPPSVEKEQKILAAMVEAHKKSEAGARAENVFEVATWLVKPLHYIPVAGEIVSAAEDIKDLAMKWAKRELSNQEWYLIAARMADIAINDYLSRKANMIATTT